ncbi:hypothetical protein UT300012_23490 [Paraclostridium bifermentans]
MNNYVNVSNFDANRNEDVTSLLSDLKRGGTFENLEDIGRILKSLASVENLKALDKVIDYLNEGEVVPEPYVVVKTCPVCGHVTFANNSDYQMQAEFCLVCGTSDNQFLHWEDLRADSENVMIWNVFFDGTSVEDTSTLKRIKIELEEGIQPDKVKPLIPREPWYKDDYINQEVIRPTMSEYEKFEKTFMLVIANSKKEETVTLAKEILELLDKCKSDELVKGTKHKLTRLALN